MDLFKSPVYVNYPSYAWTGKGPSKAERFQMAITRRGKTQKSYETRRELLRGKKKNIRKK